LNFLPDHKPTLFLDLKKTRRCTKPAALKRAYSKEKRQITV
jgi:hypothetical protein